MGWVTVQDSKGVLGEQNDKSKGLERTVLVVANKS